MAGDTIDGCVSSKMSTPEEMELGPGEFNDGSQLASQQDANSQVNPMNVSSQEASSQLTMTQDQSQPNTQPLDKLDMESVSQGRFIIAIKSILFKNFLNLLYSIEILTLVCTYHKTTKVGKGYGNARQCASGKNFVDLICGYETYCSQMVRTALNVCTCLKCSL